MMQLTEKSGDAWGEGSHNEPVTGTLVAPQTVLMMVPANRVADFSALGGTVVANDGRTELPLVPQGLGGSPAPLPPRVPSNEKCPSGHKMVFVDYTTGGNFVNMHHVHHGGCGALVCRACLFPVQPSERAFLCESCVTDKSQKSGNNLTMFSPTVYCETCVSGQKHLFNPRGQWSSSLLSCDGPCMDSLLCHPCLLVTALDFHGAREEGEVPGSQRGMHWCIVILYLVMMDPMLLGAGTPIILCGPQREVARLNNIQDPGCCSSFCQACWCRCCVTAQIYRQWESRKDEVGAPEGCLYNCSGTKAHRKPHVAYNTTKLPQPQQVVMQ